MRLPRTMKKISGDTRGLGVAGQFCHHLMLFSKTEERKQKDEIQRTKICQTGAALLRTFYFKDSGTSLRVT